MDDTFTLYDLKVEVVAGDRPMVCSHKVGDYFLVQGENLVFPKETSFSMYSLSAILPLLPAKERPLDPNDWMLSDAEIACPDPNCGARFKITRVGQLVAQCVREDKSLADLTLEEYKTHSDVFENDVYEAIDLKTCVRGRKVIGGPAPEEVTRQILGIEKFVSEHETV